MVFAQPAQAELHDRKLCQLVQELGDDFIGTGEVHQADGGEVEVGLLARRFLERLEHALAHRGAGGSGDEVGVGRGHGLVQQAFQADHGAHPATSRAGITMVTCEPGNHASPSVIGGSSSHAGGMHTRAVPDRIEILPCQRAR